MEANIIPKRVRFVKDFYQDKSKFVRNKLNKRNLGNNYALWIDTEFYDASESLYIS